MSLHGSTCIGDGVVTQLGYNNTSYGVDACSSLDVGGDPHDITAIGRSTLASCTYGTYNTALGSQALYNATECHSCTAVGANSLNGLVNGVDATAVGAFSLLNSTGEGNTAVGVEAGMGVLGGVQNVLLGAHAAPTLVSGSCNVILGNGADVTFGDISSSIVLGNASRATSNNQLVAGSDTSFISDVYFGNGVSSATPISVSINGTYGNGTDISGGDLNLTGGKGTGLGLGGKISFSTSKSSSTSSNTLNSLVEVMKLSDEHIYFPDTNTPIIASGGAIGSDSTVSVVGNDIKGTITVTSGTTSGSSTTALTLTFCRPYTSIPIVLITPTCANSSSVDVYVSNTSTASFSLAVGSRSFATSTNYMWNYLVLG